MDARHPMSKLDEVREREGRKDGTKWLSLASSWRAAAPPKFWY
jgi:hypothetical protein